MFAPTPLDAAIDPRGVPTDQDDEVLVRAADAMHAEIGAAHRRLLSLIVEIDRRAAWRDDGARDLPHWIAMRYGLSTWKAHRWVAAAHAIEGLPLISAALERGALSMDKVVELARFATPDRERGLIRWAREVSCATIRRRGDRESRATRDEIVQTERDRRVSWWWFDEGRRFGLEADLPAAQGAIVARALERTADSIPPMPDACDATPIDARRADALVALASASIAADPDPDRATVVVHATIDATTGELTNGELEDGPALGGDTVARLLCNARVQTVLEGPSGNVIGLGRMTREPSAWMVRQIRYRDRGCRFPGCGTMRFTEAHHIEWWSRGGRTDPDNLVLTCSFHHRLVHEHGWSIVREQDGRVAWRRADGTRYRAGPSPGMDPGDPGTRGRPANPSASLTAPRPAAA